MMDLLFDANTRWVLAGTALLGVSSGVLGSFALLRRRSLLGDALAHAALPGVCVAFLLTSSRSLGPLLLGALCAGLLGAACVQAIIRSTRLKEDAALGLVLSIFFAVGIVLLTLIQHSGAGNQAGLDKYVFGQAAAMVGKDVKVLAICAAVVCLLAFALFKELKILCFDSGFAAGSGFSPALLDGLLMLLLVLAVVIGLQSVGVVMMAAMLIIPAAAARLWTDRLSRIVLIAGAVGAISGAAGTVLSLQALRMPTGPLIVLAASGTFAISLLIAPKRGLIPRSIRFLRLRARVARENVLRSLYESVEKQGPWDRPVLIAEIAQKRGTNERAFGRVISALARDGFVERAGSSIRLTGAGLERAHRVVRNYRLWEVFLMYEGQLGVDHVDRDADTIEHYLSDATVAELERFLEIHGIVPKLDPAVAR
jgi:manganese/zinc/iron transport system permease protein